MSDQSSSEQLLDLVAQAKNRLRHLAVLGVESVPVKEGLTKPKPMEPTTPRAVTAPRNVSSPVPTPRSVPPVVSQGHSGSHAGSGLFGDMARQTERLEASDETFTQIWSDVGNCTRCPLHQERTHVVHTNGNQKARLMFVGEAPGADEDIQAKPFVGRAGQLLTKIIEAIGMKREEVLIGNVNRCRPPGNRQPTLEEAAICRPFLFREISAIQPEVIVVMGNTALRNLLESRDGITRVRGRFQDFRGIKVMPTFHPAYLLRDPSKKRETWEDLKMVRDYLESRERTT